LARARDQALVRNRKATAKALGIGQNTLWRRLKSYRLVRERPAAGKKGRRATR